MEAWYPLGACWSARPEGRQQVTNQKHHRPWVTPVLGKRWSEVTIRVKRRSLVPEDAHQYEGAHAFCVSIFGRVEHLRTFVRREGRTVVVSRGGLRQFNKFNDLRKSGTINLPTRSLCFLARVSHRGQRTNQPAATPSLATLLSSYARRGLRLRHSGLHILSQINFALTHQMLSECGDGTLPSLSLVPPRELKEAPAPRWGLLFADGRREPVCNDPVTGLD